MRLKINELSTKAADRDKQIDDLQSQKKTLKMHKKVLKDEVVRLRKELNESEIRA